MRPPYGGTTAALRLWWAMPLGLVVITAVVFVAVGLPALASGPGVPAQLVVRPSPPGPAGTAPASAPPTAPPAVTPHPTGAAPSPRPTRTTTVVVPPEQPVVKQSDDGPGDGGTGGSGESDDR